MIFSIDPGSSNVCLYMDSTNTEFFCCRTNLPLLDQSVPILLALRKSKPKMIGLERSLQTKKL